MSAAFLAAPSSATAKLVIRSEFIPSRPPPNLVGGGNLVHIFNTAAATWEKAFPGDQPWTLYLRYEWAPIGGNARFVLRKQGGRPHRILLGLIQFNNTGDVRFYADPNPGDDDEYTDYQEVFAETPEGIINVSRQFFDATGEARSGVDLLTIAAHEIGHGLGLLGENRASPDLIIVTRPRPFPDLQILTRGADHLADTRPLMGQLQTGAGTRVRISSLDVLANAQISLFSRPNLDPYAVFPPRRDHGSPGGGRSRGRVRRGSKIGVTRHTAAGVAP